MKENKRKTAIQIEKNEVIKLLKCAEALVNHIENNTSAKIYRNIFNHMNSTTMEYFIAELYRSEIDGYDGIEQEQSESTFILEDTIKALDGLNGIEDSIDQILKITRDYYGVDVINRDKMTIRLIAYSSRRHDIHYYLSRANEYTHKFSFLLDKEAQLKGRIALYERTDNRLFDEAQMGISAYDYPNRGFRYDEPLIRAAWEEGYRLAEIYEFWRNNIV